MPHRERLIKKLFRGMTIIEIADEEGTTKQAVSKSIKKALALLKPVKHRVVFSAKISTLSSCTGTGKSETTIFIVSPVGGGILPRRRWPGRDVRRRDVLLRWEDHHFRGYGPDHRLWGWDRCQWFHRDHRRLYHRLRAQPGGYLHAGLRHQRCDFRRHVHRHRRCFMMI